MASRLRAIGKAKAWFVEAAGGPARLQIIAVLAAVLGLDTADNGTIAAISDQLKQAFDIGNTEIGLLIAVVSFVGAVATLPAGVLADRIQRRTILVVVVALWAAAMALCATATSYTYLLVARLALGAVTAAAWPCIASLTGDFFPARERAGIYGLILSGELIGVGIGFFIAGEVSSFLGWRWSFVAMAIPSAPLAWVIWRYLPEPARGSQSRIRAGETDPKAASRPEQHGKGEGAAQGGSSSLYKKVREADVRPRKDMVLHEDPTRRPWWWAIGYLLRLPSYRLLIAASTLAYFFFAGIRGFAMIYFTKHYDLTRTLVSVLIFVLGAGAIAGLVVGGRVSERLLRRGDINARIIVPAVALFVSVPLLGVAIWTGSAWLGIALLTLGVGTMVAALAPIDAARLDIVHPRMWGRGEAGRMALRSAFEGIAPLLFGAMSGWLGGGQQGLMWTFLLMLIPMLAAAFLVLPGRRSYPRDVATAAASAEATAKSERG